MNEWLKKNATVIIVTVAGLIGMFVRMEVAISYQERKIAAVETRLNDSEKKLHILELETVVFKPIIDNIDKRLDELKDDVAKVRELLEKNHGG